MKFQFALLVFFFLLMGHSSQPLSAQVKHGPKWNFPGENVHFFLPENMRKQRIREDGKRVGYWKSKDKSYEVEAFVYDLDSPASKDRKKWDDDFLRELDLELVTSERYFSIDNEVWVVSARRKNKPGKSINARQAVMVKDNKAFIVRGIAPEDDDIRTRKVGVSIRSLAAGLPGSAPDNREATSHNGLKGSKWTAPTGDFSIFIPKGFHSPNTQEPHIVKKWNSFYYASTIAIIKDELFRRDPFRNEKSRKSFIEGFLTKFKGEVIDTRTEIHRGRTIWKIRSKISQFGSDTKCHAWFYNGSQSSYCIVLCVADVDEESQQVEEAVLESIKFSIASGEDDIITQNLLEESEQRVRDIMRKAKNKPLPKLNWDRIAGRFGGTCLLFLIGYWIWSRTR